MPSLGFELRDCQAWRDCGLPMSTTNNTAAKMYDSVASQIFGWCLDENVGGIEGAMKSMLEADPDFVLGHITAALFEMMGGGRGMAKIDATLKKVNSIIELAGKQQLNDREELYLEALKFLAKGDDFECSSVLEDVLVSYPTDRVALKIASEIYFVNGESEKMRNVIGRAKPYWNKSIPQYSFLYGMYGFGLEEMGNYVAAEKSAKHGLDLNVNDPWARHCLSHVYEMTGSLDEGIRNLSSSEKDWQRNGILLCHNYWHLGLFHLAKGQYEETLGIFDNQIMKYLAKDNGALTWNFYDAASTLTRLEFEGVDVVNRWNDLYEHTRVHVDDPNHYWTFGDAHLMLATCGAKHYDVAKKMIDTTKEFIKDNSSLNKRTFNEIGLPLMEAIYAYEQGDNEKTVDILYPIRYRILKLGGSHAQRDIFHLMLIDAASKSPNKHQQKIAKSLIAERRSLNEDCPLNERMVARTLALHAD